MSGICDKESERRAVGGGTGKPRVMAGKDEVVGA
jgi:hypothetical protein